MFKAVGLLGLVFAAGLLGIMKSSELKERIHLLEDYYKMILDLKGQINYFREPLINIFRKTEKNQISKAFIFLGRCRDGLEEKVGEIGHIWAENANEIYKGTALNAEDMEIIRYTGSFIGQTDYENQLQQFQYIEEKLAAQIEDARSIYKQKGPMYQRIGFFIGGIAAIVFL